MATSPRARSARNLPQILLLTHSLVAVAASSSLSASSAAAPLPRLSIQGPVTISGISSGADFAAAFHVAFSDLVSGSGIFAGQPPLCAVQRFPGEPLSTCALQPSTAQGPGCVGMAETGPCPCYGCPPGTTLRYDHCKQPADGPGFVNVSLLLALTAQADADGLVAPLSNLRDDRVFLYRGSKDSVYLDGSVNKTEAFFAALVSDPSTQVKFEASVPSQHCMPTVDPFLSPASCGANEPWAPPAMENCGYDGAGQALVHFYGASALTPPAPGTPANEAHLSTFNQTLYFADVWGGLASTGYLYAPPACAAGTTPCRLHVAFHGCGMAAVFPRMNTSFVLHAGFSQWADASNLVVLFPQSGGYVERNITAPSAQLGGGCFDGYGQTGVGFGWRGGPQMAAVANMIAAVGGPEWAASAPAGRRPPRSSGS